MNARDLPYKELVHGTKQFIIPIFQRDYSWGTKNCLRLWEDIVRVGSDPAAKGHFIGSVVYIAAEESTASISRWLLIDGQQRLSTLTLLLVALRNQLKKKQAKEDYPTPEEIDDHFLINRYGKGDQKSKLTLRRMDHETLLAYIEDKELPENASEAIIENFEFFNEKLEDADLGVVYNGINKLMVVDVHLTRGQDDPQMIFESLNSTGVDLTEADLIRNFVLMRQTEERQTYLYENYWQPIEVAFGARYKLDFDKFVRDYLTMEINPTPPIKSDAIYQYFQDFYRKSQDERGEESVLSELKRFANYYLAFSLDHEKHAGLLERFGRLRKLVVVATPLLLKLYDCYDRTKTLSIDEFMEAVELLESYVFRRSVCGMQTRNLGQIFASLTQRIKGDEPLHSLKVAMAQRSKNRRFPTDAEFKEAAVTKDIYEMRQRHYLLDRLENDSKEKIDTSKFTIEHILPQNPELHRDWREMLGDEWQEVQSVWLHRLGNLTLTGYNPEYSDKPFDQKKTIKGGFNESPLRLNKYVREQSAWSAKEMEERGNQLAESALRVWPPLEVDYEDVQKAELEERVAQAKRYNIDTLKVEPNIQPLLDQLRPQVMTLGDDVVELFGSKTITYRIYDFFLEIIPRRWSLELLLNLDFDECDDPAGIAKDTSDRSFVMYSVESGGVICRIKTEEDIKPALHLISQAYENLAE